MSHKSYIGAKQHIILFCGCILLCSPLSAAEITDVPDAADFIQIGKQRVMDPFDIYVHTTFQLENSSGIISRESTLEENCSVANPRSCTPKDELKWTRSSQILNVGVETGLYHDLALVLDFDVTLGNTLEFDYATGVDASSSSIDTGDANTTLFSHDYLAYHKGIKGLNLGIRYGPLNDERDPSKPMWVLSFIWKSPYLSTTYDPANEASKTSPGPVGDGIHRLTFGTAFSKRLGYFGDMLLEQKNLYRRGYLEPYVAMNYALPIADDSKALTPNKPSTSNEFRRPPSHEINLKGGFEVIASEDIRYGRKISFDFGVDTTYYTEGRNLSVMSNPLKELTYTEQFLRIAGVIGANLQLNPYFRLRTGLHFGAQTPFFVTYEDVGIDGANGTPDGQVLPNDPNDKLNPYFCMNDETDICYEKNLAASYDQVGFRFRNTSTNFFRWFISLLLTF